jgi:predicted anti-sigma-YlaC factor YlaD
MIARDSSRPITCWRVRRVLQAYLDRMLEDVIGSRVARHLACCERCTSEAETYQEIKNSLSRLQRNTPTTVQQLREFGEALLEEPDE